MEFCSAKDVAHAHWPRRRRSTGRNSCRRCSGRTSRRPSARASGAAPISRSQARYVGAVAAIVVGSVAQADIVGRRGDDHVDRLLRQHAREQRRRSRRPGSSARRPGSPGPAARNVPQIRSPPPRLDQASSGLQPCPARSLLLWRIRRPKPSAQDPRRGVVHGTLLLPAGVVHCSNPALGRFFVWRNRFERSLLATVRRRLRSKNRPSRPSRAASAPAGPPRAP